MFYSAVSNFSRGLAKISFAAGVVLLGLAVSGAQAAVVDVYSNPLGGGTADSTGWTAAAGVGGSILEENFDNNVANPPNSSAAVAFGTIIFGDSPGIGGTPLAGNISGNQYNDRADDAAGQNPLFVFSGLGVMAFGAEWNLGPNAPGTGLTFLVTFVGGGDTTLVGAIVNPSANVGFQGFFGIVSDMAIASIEILEGTNPGGFLFETFSMENARFVSAVPLPAALPLFLTALAALGFLGRRKKRMAAAAA